MEEEFFDSYFRLISHNIYYSCDEKLKSVGITHQQGRLLEIIYDNIQAGHMIRRQILEEIMGLRGPTVTSLLNGLESRGLIKRTVNPEDRRAMQLVMTPQGIELVKDIRKIFAELEKRLLKSMTKEEIQTLKLLLRKVYHNLKS